VLDVRAQHNFDGFARLAFSHFELRNGRSLDLGTPESRKSPQRAHFLRG